MKRLTLTLGLLTLAAVLAACSGATAAPGKTPVPAGSPSGDAISIVAKDLKFDQSAIDVKAGKAFSIAFDNQEGAPHNVAISDASGAGVFKGEIVSSTKVTYDLPALATGSYSFICEVHPEMKGTITAE